MDAASDCKVLRRSGKLIILLQKLLITSYLSILSDVPFSSIFTIAATNQ
jgi:hypothetical protein